MTLKTLFLLVCLVLPAWAEETADQAKALALDKSAELVVGEKAGVTAKMKSDFLENYRLAVTTNDPSKYLALVCLDGMDEAMKAVVANGAQHSLSYVGGKMDALSFTWSDPDPDDAKTFEKNGYRYHPNLPPAISLTVNIKRDPSEAKDLPTALQPTLGIKDGQLMILGMIHEKLPDPPGTKKEDPKDDDKDN